MVTDARGQSDALQERLAQASADLRARQQAAHAEAERIKTDAIVEAAAIIDRAKHDSEQHRQATEGELLRRSEQLQREQNLLKQRKEALIAQLNNLSSLANLTALEFPEEDAAKAALEGAAKVAERPADAEPADAPEAADAQAEDAATPAQG